MSKNKIIIRESNSERVLSIVNVALLCLFCLLVILPLLNILAISLNDGKDAARGGIVFWPRMFTMDNYAFVFKNGSVLSAYAISIARTVLGVVLGVVMNALAAYALKNKELPGRGVITFIIFFSMLFGGGIIPYFLLLKGLHIYNTFWVYILPGIYSAWNILLIRTYMESLGASLEESAKLEGAGDVTIFFHIVLPLSTPILAVVALYVGVGHWNDWFTGLYYVSDAKLQPMATVLQKMLDTQEMLRRIMARSSGDLAESRAQHMVTAASLKAATVIITAGPILLFYPSLQKYFVKGIMVGAIKG